MTKSLAPLALGVALLLSSAASADTLYTNVNGIDADASGKIARFDGLLVGEDGKVLTPAMLSSRGSRPR